MQRPPGRSIGRAEDIGRQGAEIMISRTVVALSIAAFAVASTASAQENATFTLRSGERLSGQLMDLGGVGFTVRINDQERRIPTDDVAVIDFTGAGTSQSDWDRLSSGQFAVLRDGQIVTGQLTDAHRSRAPEQHAEHIHSLDRRGHQSDRQHHGTGPAAMDGDGPDPETR
jgi:hypothetical protein